ncbi:MAG: UvrD-helicase domain-containing protein [Terracidiphilus sp.]|jgi:ATP-dependent exoDNAse (exonuclease V) beta subunit
MSKIQPPDQTQRDLALDPERSILVQAPAGSGKTDLLTRRFLRLLAEVEEPGQVVAITFTKAAAAEMRHRILGELENATANKNPDTGEFSMAALAHRVLKSSNQLGWRILELPAQLRISTVDSFCRDLALQQPLLSGFSGSLEIAAQPDQLYRRAARETLRKIDQTDTPLSTAIEELLIWRDNNWQEMEELLIEMLQSRDRWMHGFLLEREPDWQALRERLERPFAHAVQATLDQLSRLLDQAPNARQEALELARFACEQTGGQLHRGLAELVGFPSAIMDGAEEARQAYVCLAALLLTDASAFRKQVNKLQGFPADKKREKNRILELIAALASISGLEASLAAARALPPATYTDDDWQIVRACFTLLRHAAAELQIVFAETGAVDFIEVAQIAQRVLRGDDGLPTDAALAVSDGIRHLLVDEFQDTSRRQHQLLTSLIAPWPELDPGQTARTCFFVGDPMQSIYFFRDADAELFPRVKALGLEIPHDEALLFDFVSLTANFRTTPELAERQNEIFIEVFAVNDGSGVTFTSAQPAREAATRTGQPFTLHLDFVSQVNNASSADAAKEQEAARQTQIEEIVALIHSHLGRIEEAKAQGEKYRIAVLARAKSHLAPIAHALRQAQIPFRAIELEELATRPEVRDALALSRALLNPQDRVAWLGVLRAPWCGLPLQDLHCLASNDDPGLTSRPLPDLLAERLPLLSDSARPAAARVLQALAAASSLRASQPTASLGTWLQQIWLQLGGDACVSASARANLNRLWSCLDQLPRGAEDLLGLGLDSALAKLTALPNPDANSDHGVQLMTIHKSKGLEFEVVIVPELQASNGRGKRKMLAWLERGLAQPDDSGEVTEFLIAPFQRKGADRGNAKAWVDRVYREREQQEMRRILYVAATRARDELHLFARPACKEQGGVLTLVEPANSLLATAWPALQNEVRARFEDWRMVTTASEPAVSQEIESLAASAVSNLLVMPSPAKPTILRRLSPDFQPGLAAASVPRNPAEGVEIRKPAGAFTPGFLSGDHSLYSRHEGGLLSRALGAAVHTLLEELARLRTKLVWEASRAALRQFEPRIISQIRAVGLDRQQARQIAAQALQFALSASRDPVGSWILSPHLSAASEAAWTGVVSGSPRAVRVDRVFRAGPAPCSAGEDCWWIIDYKTAHQGNLDPASALPHLRALFAPQIEAYAELLRNLDNSGKPIFAGLYYPRMALLDWWQI